MKGIAWLIIIVNVGLSQSIPFPGPGAKTQSTPPTMGNFDLSVNGLSPRTVTFNVTSGQILYCTAWFFAGSSTITSVPVETWAQSPIFTDPSTVELQGSWAVAHSTASYTFTLTNPGNNAVLGCVAINGPTVLDKFAGINNPPAATVLSFTVTGLAGANDMVIATFGTNSSNTSWASPTGGFGFIGGGAFPMCPAGGVNVCMLFKVSTGTSESPGITQSAAIDWTGLVGAFK